jgi:NAD(P)-dependent dehydrogenase (short-subunit alcohol dehydrogenase family)
LKDTTVYFYNDHVNCNIRGLFFLTQKALPHLAHGGRIVIVSSVAARLGVETQGIYSATKAAGEALARVWAKELGHEHGITVNCVNPGPVATGEYRIHVLPCVNAYLFRSMAREYERVYRGYAADHPVDPCGSKSWRGGGYCAFGFVFVY